MQKHSYRARLIQDCLLGLTTWLREPDAFLYPVTDSLLLYFHRPLVISFWRMGGGRLELSFRSSLSRPELLDESTAALVAGRGTLPGMPYAILVEEETPKGLEPLDTETHKAALLLTLSPSEKGSSTERSLFESMLLAALERADPASLSDKICDLVSEVQDEGGVDPVEDSLRTLFASVLDVGTPIHGGREVGFLYPDELFDVSAVLGRRRCLGPNRDTGLGARILLFRHQEPLLARFAQSTSLNTERLAELLRGIERPFSPIKVPEIWNSLTLGTITFQGPRPGQHSAEARPRADWSGLETLFSSGRGSYRLLVPIHVGGVPWAVLVRGGLTPGSPDWLDSYHFYRELVPRLATALRVGAKKVYLDALGRALISELERRPTAAAGSELAKHVNDRWRQLAERLPFELPRLRLRTNDENEGGEASELRLPSGRRLAIEMDDGFFKPILRYDPLDPADIVEACRRAVDEFARTESSVQLRTVATATHALGLPIDELKRLAESVEPPGLREAIKLRLGRLKALEVFSNYLVSPSRRHDRIKKSNIKLADLVSWSEQRAAEILALYADPRLGEQTWRVAGQILETGQFKVEVDKGLALDVPVTWFPEQAEIAIDGLMANAIRFNDLSHPGLALWVGAEDSGEAQGVFIRLINHAARSPEELADLVRSLNQAADPRYVGVSLLAMASQACRLLPPRWEIDYENRMVVILQLGWLT